MANHCWRSTFSEMDRPRQSKINSCTPIAAKFGMSAAISSGEQENGRRAPSIGEVGIVEPLVVARRGKDEGPFVLIDGHLRHAALSDLGNSEASCLIADDDKAFTYNKRVNRLATIQEPYMIVKAIERGVSEEKLAKALNVDIKRIKTKKTLLDGVCPEVAEMLKDKSVDTQVFALLQKMKPMGRSRRSS